MRVSLSATGKFHFLELSSQLDRLGVLDRFYTGYPKWKLKELVLKNGTMISVPWLHAPFMGLMRHGRLPQATVEYLDKIDRHFFDELVARQLRPCDIFTAISGCGLNSGRRAQALGARYICDRGSTHITHQNAILAEEHRLWRQPFTPTHPKIVETELAEYEQADHITVPSDYAKRTFLDFGVSAQKITTVRYGVDLKDFFPTGKPDPNRFIVIFIGSVTLRKGVQYLAEAFSRIRHPHKELWLLGQIDFEFLSQLRKMSLWPTSAKLFGHVKRADLKHFLSKADVLVLPSIEDGFGLVVSQALACGCPVIASENTGGSELIQPQSNGLTVPARNGDALWTAIEWVLHTRRSSEIRVEARQSVERLGGWDSYGMETLGLYRKLIGGLEC